MEKQIITEQDLSDLKKDLDLFRLPFLITIEDKRSRSKQQNALYQRWVRDVSEQSGYSMEEVHYHCKRKWGISILMRDNPQDAHDYQLLLDKLDGIEEDEAVRIMDRIVRVTPHLNVKQMTELLDDMWNYYNNMFQLTDPEKIL